MRTSFLYVSLLLLAVSLFDCSHSSLQQRQEGVPDSGRNQTKELSLFSETPVETSPFETATPPLIPAQPVPDEVQRPNRPASSKIESKAKPAPIPPSSAPSRIMEVTWSTVNLREGPGMNYRIVGSLKKKAGVHVLEYKGSWVRIRLDDAREVWMSKSAIDDPKTPPRKAFTPPATATPASSKQVSNPLSPM